MARVKRADLSSRASTSNCEGPFVPFSPEGSFGALLEKVAPFASGVQANSSSPREFHPRALTQRYVNSRFGPANRAYFGPR